MRKLSRSSKVIVALGLTVALLGVALGATIYTLTVGNTMRLSLTLGLELRDGVGDPIASYAWGDFTDGQAKVMASAVGDGKVHLVNQGNGAVDVAWNSTCPATWLFWINEDGGGWSSGTTKSIPVGGELELEITLKEMSAVGGVPYSFDLNFNVVA